MKKIIVILCLVFSPLGYGKVMIHYAKPEMLIDQVNRVDINHIPSLNTSEQNLIPMLKKQLAQKNYQPLYQQLIQSTDNNRSSAMSYFLGQLALQLNLANEASAHFSLALKQTPNYAKAMVGAALAAISQEKYEKAAEHIASALQLGTSDPHLYRYLGFSYLEQKQFMSAAIAFEQAKLLLPDDQQLNDALVYSYSNSGQIDAALAMLEQMLAIEPNKKRLWLQRANIYLAKENYDITIASLETALRLGEQQKSNIALTAQLQLRYGSTFRAVELYQKVWNEYGDTQMATDAIRYLIDTLQYSQAKQLLQKVKVKKTRDPQVNAELFYLTGQLAFEKQQYQQAEQAFKQALQHNAIHGLALLSLAKVHRINKNTHQTQMLLLRAIEVPSVQLQALTEYADLHLSLGNTRQALVFLRKALKLKPNEQTLVNNINTLQQMVLQQDR